MGNQLMPEEYDNPWIPYKHYLRGVNSDWAAFMDWVESTQLYAAIINRPEGVDFYTVRTSDFSFDLNMSSKRITGAHDLPVELLANFFQNWPEKDKFNQVQKLLI